MMWCFANAFPLLTSSDPIAFDLADEPATVDRASSVMTALLAHLDRCASVPLVEVLPGLANFKPTIVGRSVLTTRTANTLDRLGISTWGDLGSVSIKYLRFLPNVGSTTVEEIARSAILQSLRDPRTSGPQKDEEGRTGEVSESESDLISFTRLLALWAQLETDDATTLADVLNVTRSLPSGLERDWIQLGRLKLSSFQAPMATLQDLVDQLLADFEPTWRKVLDERILADEPITLRELGDRIGVSHQRVLQIQTKVEEKLQYRLTLATFAPLQWRAESLLRALGSTAPEDDAAVKDLLETQVETVEPARRALVRSLLLYAAGPYEVRNGWLTLEDANLPTPAGLLALADEDGLIEYQTAMDWLGGYGINEAFVNRWLGEKAKTVVEGRYVIPRFTNVVDHCIARLALRGEPTTAEALAAEIGEGHNAKGVRNRFFEDRRVVRVNKTEWALSRWGLEEYTGIADEIVQRIEEQGGRVELKWLVKELVDLFHVAEVSVRAYAAAPMFVIDNGFVRRRMADESYEVSDDISGCRGVFHVGPGCLSLVVSVNHDVLRGSGRSLPPAVAARLGVAPGRSRAFSHPDGEVQVTWPETAALGPTLGSIRSVIEATGAGDGDRVRLTFDAPTQTLAAERVLDVDDANQKDALFMLTGLRVEGDAHSAVADAVGASVTNVRRVLATRGDNEVLELLGSPPTDAPLEAALADLAGALGEIE